MACLFDVYNIRPRPHHCNTHHQVYYIFYDGSIHALRVVYQYMLYIPWLAQRILHEHVVQQYDRTTPLPGLCHVQSCSIDWYVVLVPGTGATRHYCSTCTRYWFEYLQHIQKRIRYEVPGAYSNILGQRTPGRINSLGGK